MKCRRTRPRVYHDDNFGWVKSAIHGRYNSTGFPIWIFHSFKLFQQAPFSIWVFHNSVNKFNS